MPIIPKNLGKTRRNKAKIEQFEQINEEALENQEKLAKLYQRGVIDSNGEPKDKEKKIVRGKSINS